MNTKAGHCNEARYLVKIIDQYRLVLDKLYSKSGYRNRLLILTCIPIDYGGDVFPFKLTRFHFPIKIAFTLTINKAQGKSATKCGILLPKMYGHTVRYMLHYQGAEIQTI